MSKLMRKLLHNGILSVKKLPTTVQCMCVIASDSKEEPVSVLRNTHSLTADFQLLTQTELYRVVKTYNHVLPSFYGQQAVVDCINNDDLGTLFNARLYVEREVKINMLMDAAKKKNNKKNSSTHAESAAVQPKPESIQLSHRPDYRIFSQNCLQALNFGQQLVLDCGYEEVMRGRESVSYLRQVCQLIKENKTSTHPFGLHLCNLQESSPLWTKNNDMNIDISKEMIATTHQCFTKIFNKQDIIMLSPDAPLYMEKFDSTKVYVVGGLIDLGDAAPQSYRKAERLGVETRKLPLDVYVDWSHGHGKRLMLHTVLRILLRLVVDGDWDAAIRNALSADSLKGLQLQRSNT